MDKRKGQSINMSLKKGENWSKFTWRICIDHQPKKKIIKLDSIPLTVIGTICKNLILVGFLRFKM